MKQVVEVQKGERRDLRMTGGVNMAFNGAFGGHRLLHVSEG